MVKPERQNDSMTRPVALAFTTKKNNSNISFQAQSIEELCRPIASQF
jgi:hypothetical protein